MTTPLRPLRVGFMARAWESADRSFRHIFVLLDPACEPDPRPGIAIFTDRPKHAAVAVPVDAALPIIYWRMFVDTKERDTVAAKLGKHPRYYG